MIMVHGRLLHHAVYILLQVKAVPSHASKVSCRKETYTVIRQYGIHKGTPKFRRIISSVRDSSGTEIPKAILQYFFVVGEKISVDILPHGNSSRNPRPYMRTQPSTLKNLKEVSKIKSRFQLIFCLMGTPLEIQDFTCEHSLVL